MKRIIILLVTTISFSTFAEIKWPEICDEPVWAEQKCLGYVNSVQKNSYQYLQAIAGTSSVLKALIKSRILNSEKISSQMLDLVESESTLGGFIDALKNDSTTVKILIPPRKVSEVTSVYSGCLFLRDYVVADDEQTCQTFTKPLAKYFYLSIRNYRTICSDTEPMLCKDQL